MWVKSFDKFKTKMLYKEDSGFYYLRELSNIYTNDSGEYLYSLEDNGYIISSGFPSVTISIPLLPQFDGTYEFVLRHNSEHAVYYNASKKYYALAISTRIINVQGTTSVVDWFFTKSNHFDIEGGLITIDEDGNLISNSESISVFAYDNTNVFFKREIDDKLSDEFYYIDEDTGDITSKTPDVIKSNTIINPFAYVSSEKLYDQFTGNGASRYVGWLWFYVNNDLRYEYRKNVDILNDGSGNWSLVFKGQTYWGSEPTRDSNLTYSIKQEDQTEPPTPDITVNYTVNKLNAFEGSYSIPNSTEVTHG